MSTMPQPGTQTTGAAVPAPEAGSIPRIGDVAPDFTAITTQGELTFSKWQDGQWVVLFSHPADFTPVCSTELTELARRNAEFEKRKTRLIACRSTRSTATSRGGRTSSRSSTFSSPTR